MEDIILFVQKISLRDIFNFIINPEFEGMGFYIKVIFIIISLILLGVIILLISLSNYFKFLFGEDIVEFITYRPFGQKKTHKEWTKITKRLESNREAEHKLAVIEADSLLEEILERIGHRGETMEDRLKKLDSTILANPEQVLEAHKIRNNIVHKPDYHLTLEEAKKTIKIYQEALRELEII